jgi:hypothetical protein
MPLSAIPGWTMEGVIPPHNPVSPVSVERSPYRVGMVDFILRYSTSANRRKILEGFLNFRQALQNIGLIHGFQWVDGSFLENVEYLEHRSPNDLDVVTFAYLPNGLDQRDLFNQDVNLFTPPQSKGLYLVDSYFVQLNNVSAEYLIERSRYWYSMWSHRRSGQWKGYIELDLNPINDQIALANLQRANTREEGDE